MNARQTQGVGLFLTALSLLALPGLAVNNLLNSGLIVNSTFQTCDASNPVCTLSATVGCQASPSNCALSGSSISFLNGKSPFTQVIQGNIFALFTQLNGPGYSGVGAQVAPFGSHGPFDQVQGGPSVFYQVNCQGNTVTDTSQRNWVISQCTQTYTDNSNTTLADSATWNNWNTKQSGFSATTPLFHLKGNVTAPGWGFACSWQASVNYTAVANGPGFNYFGCDLVKRSNSINSTDILNPNWSLLVAMPNNIGAMKSGVSHQYLFAQLENWDTRLCFPSQLATGGLAQFNSASCQSFVNGFKGFNLPFFFQNTSFVPNQGITPIFGFFGGLIILMIGLGMDIKTGGPGLAFNNQATKFAEVMGIGLIVWGFMYSEFSAWFSSGYFPYGLDGTLGIFSVAISGCFFMGVLFMGTQSGGTGSG